MTIRNRFILTICFSVILLLTGVILAGVGIWQSSTAIQDLTDMDAAVTRLYELRILSLEYEANPSERAAEQWRLLYATIGDPLKRTENIPGEVIEAYANMGDLFEKLRLLKDNAPDSAAFKRARNQLFNSLHIESQRVIDWATDISADSRNSFMSRVWSFSLGTLMILVLIASVTVIIIFSIGRYILRSISTLREGTQRVAKGDLLQRIELGGSDEMADLANVFNAMTRDLHQYYLEITQSNRLLRSIDECNRVLARGGDERALLRDICQSIIATAPYRFCWIGMREEGPETAIIPIAWSDEARIYLENAGYVKSPVRVEPADPVHRAVTGNRPVIFPRVMDAVERTAWCVEAKLQGCASIIALPLHAGETVIGCLSIYDGNKEDFGRSEVSLLCELAQTISNGIQSLRDQSKRKQAEDDRSRLEEQLLQAQKMEAVGQLAGGIAHDFNNLLQVILVNAELVQDAQAEGAHIWEGLEQIRNAGERAADLTRQLLAFSRRQVIQPMTVDINLLVQGVLKMLRRVIGEHIALSFTPSDRPAMANVDKSQMEQVLMNLCVNARDAMPQGGKLSLQTENRVLDAEFCRDHLLTPNEPYVLVSIADTGQGMDAATRGRIFEPFFTTKAMGHGTGLGLATVYGIVKQHKGVIHVHSELGIGTVFKVYLPAASLEEENRPMVVRPTAMGGTETILAAEDEPAVLDLLTSILQSAGYTVLRATDGMEALRLFEEHAADIDLVLLDVVMPGLSGRQVMDEIKGRGVAVPFLFSSGYSPDAIHMNFVIEQGFRLIQKPYRREDLLWEVRQVLDARKESAAGEPV